MNFMNGMPQENESESTDDSSLSDTLGQGETTFVTSDDGSKQKVSPGTLGLVGLMAICAGATYFMYLRGGPSSAAASEDTTAAQIDTMLAESQKHATLMKQVLKDAPQVVQRFREASVNTQVPLKELSRNPFLMRTDRPETAAVESEATSRRRREEERSAAAQAAQGLRVQTILFGTRRIAMVNGRMVREGDVIDSFVVEQIQQNSVIVRSGSYRFELTIAK
jgi:hypothetical protein